MENKLTAQYDFTNKAILCETTEEVESLATIATAQGYYRDIVLYIDGTMPSRKCFKICNTGDRFSLFSESYIESKGIPITTYSDFIATPAKENWMDEVHQMD